MLLELLAGVLLLAPPVLAWRAYLQCRSARRASEAALAELRALRLQASNTLELLMAAGFKPHRRGWEDDWAKTQVRDSSPPEVSWFRAL